jgi:lipid A 3-O-deacylase
VKQVCAIVLFLLVSVPDFAQKPAEIGIITDNDLYTSPENDQYYTNGLELYYRYLNKHSNIKLAKRITEFRVGQYIYNSQSAKPADINFHDRPFAGYLFAEAGINKFYLNENVLKINFQAGVVGPESQAQEVQEGLHNLVGYDKVRGWEYQIHTALGLQAQVYYSNKVLGAKYYEKVDFHVVGEVNAGTIWTSLNAGLMSRISLGGLLLPMYDSTLHGAALDTDPEKYKGRRELFLYLSPMLNYQIYDATIQGGLFNDDSPVTFPLIPLRFNAEVGVKYRRNNWNLSYSFNYRGKELSNNVIEGYYYGSINIGYFLH